MKSAILRWKSRMKARVISRRRATELPFREEVLGIEQLSRHAASLASRHQHVARGGSNLLLRELAENEKILRQFNRDVLANEQSQVVDPATEWLIDNFYLIEEQIQMSRRHLPRGYSRELPRLLDGPLAGMPRVYEIVKEVISHLDAQIDYSSLQAFVGGYQTVSPLKLGELWAIPIMLRLALIENLQRICTRLSVTKRDRDLASGWVEQLQSMAEKNPSQLLTIVGDMARSDIPLSSSFVAEFCLRLSRQNPIVHIARTWLEQRLVEQGQSVEQLINLEGQTQAADQISVSHTITSLRLLSSLDWKEFVESLSVVEKVLREDPAGVYVAMDFNTRNRYRNAIESFAKRSVMSEGDIARLAIRLADEGSKAKGRSDRSAHVGFYLVDRGQQALEKAASVRWRGRRAVERAIHKHPLAFYLGGLTVIASVVTCAFLLHLLPVAIAPWLLISMVLLLLLASSQVAIAFMNWLSMVLVKPRLLPRMDYTHGIAADARTMVVVPTMLTSPEGIEHLLETLELHYLSNRDANIHFALLTDFGDASREKMSADDGLLQKAREGIEALNSKYQDGIVPVFYLFHRPRRWNPAEGRWMGYERKRGKLTELNALLRGGPRDSFSEIVGDLALLPPVKYVITLDTDTRLPREAARQLVSSIAHPLNRPEFDEAGVVTEGYSILQPRVAVSLPSARRSWFVRIFAGDAGIDPYTRAVSDVYQDVFNEGSFIGKGIYDVDAFERALKGRFPENTILSHDLIESCHARSALVSDVLLFEEYPSRYNVDVDRRHRWIRGDWQISQWLLPRVPGADARRIENPLSELSRWKILDNLRRSLVPAAIVMLMVVTWFLLPELGTWGTVLILALLALPNIFPPMAELVRKNEELPWSMHLKEVAHSLGRQIGQILLTLAFLPYDAYVSLDAIVRTLVRQFVTKKRLLEWKTASDAERTARTDLGSFFLSMWISPILALAGTGALVALSPAQLPIALPILCLWAVSPWIAWRISQPIEPAESNLSSPQLSFLRRTARKTWHFFETFVNEQENWLPPDNFQEEPAVGVASRTSPTNMGLSLMANLAARDFGYITTGRLIGRTLASITTMERLERHRGHFYNWYDTRSLQPLLPHYVSSVDSGNLAGHLLVLGSGLREIADAPIFSKDVFSGLLDTTGILRDLGENSPQLAEIEAKLEEAPMTLSGAFGALKYVSAKVALLSQGTEVAADDVRKTWVSRLQVSCDEHTNELLFVAPWLEFAPSMTKFLETMQWKDGELHSDATFALLERLEELDEVPTLREVSLLADSHVGLIEQVVEIQPLGTLGADRRMRLAQLSEGLVLAGERARERMASLEELARRSDEMAEMDFTFLYDEMRELFAIGYNVSDRRRDTSYYDLLASEARLCSYVAIALGQIPQDHWFSLGRLLIASHGQAVLISWSGSMFEYLMPLLVMPTYEDTLLDHTCRVAVKEQIAYGEARHVPWGISESGYHRTDVHLNYQYRAFGVPGMGLKRGLAEDLVIAPYATMMSLAVAPREACENMERMSDAGFEGPYGFYEAVDYTPSRVPPGQEFAIIKSYMAHHQGMGLLGLLHVLKDAPMQRRFSACLTLKAADLLLQERVPRTDASIFSADLFESEKAPAHFIENEKTMRIFTRPSSPAPEVHLLSNGRYHVAISSAGGGYSQWRGLDVTRWREDPTRDCWGSFIYLRDMVSGDFWSAAYQPALRETKNYEAIFTQARAEFRQRHGGWEMHTEICVSPEDDVELRRITITNRSRKPRTLEITSYSEVVLASRSSDAVHPAFSGLFVQTEFIPEVNAIFCTRRPRTHEEKPPFLFHLIASEGVTQGDTSIETDRMRFVGRGGTLASPAAMHERGALSNTAGSVLDPVISLRRVITVGANSKVTLNVVTGVTETREGAVTLAEKYNSSRMSDRAFDLAWTHSQVILRHLNATEGDAQLYGRMASALIYADPARRANPAILRTNRRGQSNLWSYGISGDVPVVLLRISSMESMGLVRQAIQAHSYWRMKGLAAELVIVNEDESAYRQSLHEHITAMIASGIESPMMDKPGGIFVRRLEQIPAEDRVLLRSVARIVLDDENGSIIAQLENRGDQESPVALLVPPRSPLPELPDPTLEQDLIFFNGLGGFSEDGKEYVITLQPGQMTPAPWVNVIANPSFGCLISESGSGYTWVENAHEFRLTAWSNDPVQDTPSEAIYIRDEETGLFWSPTPLPARGATPYTIRHGFGYTVFEHTENGIASELWVFVAIDAPVKFAVLKLRNLSGRPRSLSATSYCEWVLGELRQKNQLHIHTEVDPRGGALLARNPYNTAFPDRIAFMDANGLSRSVTGNRREFIGRNGTYAQPAAMKRARLSGKAGAGLDPCCAMQIFIELEEDQTKETTFRLGVGRSVADVQELLTRYRRTDSVRQALEQVHEHWRRILGAVQVETPDPSINALANGWLLYQTVSSRIWGRTGFYQSGGAYGFRDQLQDTIALIHSAPHLTREHLLRAAGRQFKEGDVQHWWHPPTGNGVRTQFSDDYLWLPYVTCKYVTALSDTGVLDERIPFIEGRQLKPGEEAYYELPYKSEEAATLYEHCVRAIERGISRMGEHGLPLIGCGDWNDGMNMVGKEGRGESVWLAFFLFDVLRQFASLATLRGDTVMAEKCMAEGERLRVSIEANAWDGEWYRRAYFDNGEPLGSSSNAECQIDSLPQSWSVISGAGDAARSRQAMEAVDWRLVRRGDKLIQLFDPPFDKSPLDPGYIKGYIPGVRENGGQYTHGAIWTIMAFAMMGDGDRAWELFNMLNPVLHGSTPKGIATYRVEPYVVAADVYGVSPHTGRGGWTWYTGSAGWMYRLLVETLLGLRLEGTQVRLSPLLPKAWNAFTIRYRHRSTNYKIRIVRGARDAADSLSVDGTKLNGKSFPLIDDGKDHAVELVIG